VDEWRRITKEQGADIVVLDMLPLLDTRHKEQDITASFVADLVLQVLCYVCEKERLLNHERASAGIAAARARGVKFGRRPIEKPTEFEAIRELWEKQKISASEAARRLGVSRPTFMTWVGK
jgi:DNA invertase Pin-like site-specific DNA recombinase